MTEISKLIKIQEQIAPKIIIEDCFQKIRYIAGADVAFDKKYAYGAVVVMRIEDLNVVNYALSKCRIKIPYIPTFLSFREDRPIIMAYRKLYIKPDILLCDGQGIAHPRQTGLAVVLGITLDIPTIGVAKSKLCGDTSEPKLDKKSYSFIYYEGKKVGIVLRTQNNVKPVFVSPGHKITLQSAREIVLRTITKYRLPEPLRYAHILSQLNKKSMPTRYYPRILGN